MIYNNVDLKDYLKIIDIRRDILPPVDITLLDIPGRAGKRFVKSNLRERTIEVDVEVKGKGRESLRREVNRLGQVLFTGKPEKLRFSDEIDKYYVAILADTTFLEEIYVYGTATLKFICPDPYKYGYEIIHEIDNEKKFYNSGFGNAKGRIELNVLSDTDYISIANRATGEFIELDGSYNKGDKLIIDLENENVLRNGSTDLINVTISSDFFDIVSGENHIVISDNVEGKIRYRERWL